jgi:preprotein translocase subunit SecA
MDYLKEGIGLRAMAQRDPLVEYQNEGYLMFQQMMGAIREETTGFMFNLEVQVQQSEDQAVIEARGLAAPVDNRAALTYTSPNEDGAPEQHAANEKPANPPKNNGAGSSFFKN